MPTIYSSLYNNFIRQGSTFAKSITTHGYAQSVVVAGTHLNSQNRPSFTRRNNRSRFGGLYTLQLQSSLHSAASNATVSSSSNPTAAALGFSSEHRLERAAQNGHGGLDAYFEALQKQQDIGEVDDKEWSQFQFPKRIEWNPTPDSVLVGNAQSTSTDRASATQEDALQTLTPEEEVLAQAKIAAANETGSAADPDGADIDAVATEVVHEATAAEPAQSRAPSPPLSASQPQPSGSRTSPPPSTDAQSTYYSEHLLSLSETGRYAEIPAVFEAMLATRVQPVVGSYNALLMAAIHLPSKRIEIVSKALKIYADMRGRKVLPDSDTYNILVGLLASRSIEVSALRRALEDKRVRFGGMEEPGKFMFASHEFEHAILCEEDRLDLAMKLFDDSITTHTSAYSSETYHQLIAACAQAGRIPDMVRTFEHLESQKATPYASIFPAMITAFANSQDLVSAVDCYNEYKELAISNDKGEATLLDRQDALAYAAVVHAYVISGKADGARQFYDKIMDQYGAGATEIKTTVVRSGFVKGFIQRGIYQEALLWAQTVEGESQARTMAEIAVMAADHGDGPSAMSAYGHILPLSSEAVAPTAALLALSVRQGDVATASKYWSIMSNPVVRADSSFIEPTAMYTVALIGSGQAAEGLWQSDAMFERVRRAADRPQVADEIDEATKFISSFMQARGVPHHRVETLPSPTSVASPSRSTTINSPYPSSATGSSFEDTFDPHAAKTDFKGSSLISDDLDGANPRRGPRLQDALNRFRNIRRTGRHPRYITYSKLISAAAREGKMGLCHDILAMAKHDVPLLSQYTAVRYGWSSILDAMVGACLTAGQRQLAEKYHLELLDIGAAPSANTFGLYITSLKESTRTFDEASEAVRIFQRAKAEGVEPSSFLYNALIGKLGKARRIDDCLFYFAEMQGLGIKPTSVTYGTIVNALCRVSDEKFAEELFEEMENMSNYKPRPAPYNSMMQFFLTTKRDKSKVLAYYERMKAKGIFPTSHTYKLLIDTHATLEPVDLVAAEAVLSTIRAVGMRPEAVHFASLIHARGCTLHDMDGARKIFDQVYGDSSLPVNASIFQALLEAMVANHKVTETGPVLALMKQRGIELTAYIANTLIHGWASENAIEKARIIYDTVGREHREPSTYEAMTRAYLAVEEREGAKEVVGEMLSRGYPTAVANKVLELLSGGQEFTAE
jgi:pentatricopeptide repeat protein